MNSCGAQTGRCFIYLDGASWSRLADELKCFVLVCVRVLRTPSASHLSWPLHHWPCCLANNNGATIICTLARVFCVSASSFGARSGGAGGGATVAAGSSLSCSSEAKTKSLRALHRIVFWPPPPPPLRIKLASPFASCTWLSLEKRASELRKGVGRGSEREWPRELKTIWRARVASGRPGAGWSRLARGAAILGIASARHLNCCSRAYSSPGLSARALECAPSGRLNYDCAGQVVSPATSRLLRRARAAPARQSDRLRARGDAAPLLALALTLA